jgi:hypothetical protein
MIQRPKNSPSNRDSSSPHPEKFNTQKSPSKVLASVLWYKDGILLVDCLEKAATIMVKFCDAFLDKMEYQVVSKH